MVNFKDIKSNPFYFQVNMRLVNHIQIIKFVFIANFFIDYQGQTNLKLTDLSFKMAIPN